jgi:excisionase family DNA binding protein
MATHEHIGSKARSGGDADDDLTRLVRIIARQAAQEAFAVFRNALEASGDQCGRPLDLPTRLEAAESRSEPGERYLSVAEVAKRLDVSEKTVRRKITSGELPAHRVGKLIRIGERSLLSRLAGGRLRQPEGE